MAVSDLDDVGRIEALDPTGILAAVESFPDQVREGWRRGIEARGLPDSSGLAHVVVLGMGGSGVAGDVVRALLGSARTLPFLVVKGYRVPDFVGQKSLVFAVSYSGDTEETQAAFAEAMDRGAQGIVISSGGGLAAEAQRRGIPWIEIPGGFQPRASLGYLSMPILAVLDRLQLAESHADEVDEATKLLDERASAYSRDVPTAANPAKRLGALLVGRMPVIYGTEGLGEVAALRWKTQMNENAKAIAFFSNFPELGHNEAMGWESGHEITTQRFALVLLRHAKEHPRIARRIEATLPLIEPAFGLVEQVRAEASGALARLLDLTYMGDATSVYHAIALGVDPGPVELIEVVKRRLAI